MSNEMYEAASGYPLPPDYTPSHRLMLTHYAFRFNEIEAKAWPGLQELQTLMQLNKRSVLRIRKRLIADGFLTQLAFGHRMQRSEFRVHFPPQLPNERVLPVAPITNERVLPVAPITNERVLQVIRKGVTGDPKGCYLGHPKRKEIKERKGRAPLSSSQLKTKYLDAEVNLMWAHIIDQVGETRAIELRAEREKSLKASYPQGVLPKVLLNDVLLEIKALAS
jgi:hypothetical protein